MWPMQEFMRHVGKALRTENDDFTREPLPERWIHLIRHLDERERREPEVRQWKLTRTPGVHLQIQPTHNRDLNAFPRFGQFPIGHP